MSVAKERGMKMDLDNGVAGKVYFRGAICIYRDALKMRINSQKCSDIAESTIYMIWTINLSNFTATSATTASIA